MKLLLALLAVVSALVAIATLAYVRRPAPEPEYRWSSEEEPVEWPVGWFADEPQGGHAIRMTGWGEYRNDWTATNSPAWESGEVGWQRPA